MHDAACPLHRCGQAARIEKIALDKGKIPMSACGRDEFRHPRAKVVVTDDHLAIAQQSVNQIAADKSRCTCHERSHDDASCWRDDIGAGAALTGNPSS